MPVLVAVGVGGALGALARYGLDSAIPERAPGAFPWATFAINISGSLLLGLLYVLFSERISVDAWVRTGLTVGLLGSYTTFSTLSLETFRLLQRGSVGLALANGLGSLSAGILALYAGVLVGRLL